jgi:hypothetical protein
LRLAINLALISAKSLHEQFMPEVSPEYRSGNDKPSGASHLGHTALLWIVVAVPIAEPAPTKSALLGYWAPVLASRLPGD